MLKRFSSMEGMKKKKKPTTDVNVTAFHILEAVTNSQRLLTFPPKKNPAAVALGRLGGIKGGPSRKEKLDAERRRQIASDAARARWAKKRKA
jgi:hypothetical protein